MGARLRLILGALWLCLALASGALAQEPDLPDFARWGEVASQAEALLEEGGISDRQIEALRGDLADWRDDLLAAQSVNQQRIETVQAQIEALGPPPADGETEPDGIARQRGELNDQLEQLMAPRRRAESAYTRANGLIGEIDARIRSRQAAQLLELGPTPLNPTLWPEAVTTVTGTALGTLAEVRTNWAEDTARAQVRQNLPLVLLYLVGAVVLLARGRYRAEQLGGLLDARIAGNSREVISFAVSLFQVALPVLGIFLLIRGIEAAALLGPMGEAIVEVLPVIGLTAFGGRWLGARVFARGARVTPPLQVDDRLSREGRIHAGLLGLLLGFDLLARQLSDFDNHGPGTDAVLAFPVIALTAILLFRMGQILLRDAEARGAGAEEIAFRAQVTTIFARAVQIVAVLGLVAAAVGYLTMARAMLFPMVLTLALLGLLALLGPLVRDTWALVRRLSPDEADDALVPVLVNFALALAALPVLALIWGARRTDLAEVWARFRGGFPIGDTRISPTDFVVFALVFFLGLLATRLVQGTLKSTVLPRTRMDTGGRNAVVSGLGYVGVLLAVLLAVTSAGIDLSSLAIVAGALSVGIGFGLQNIVSNFVSGIILLIERPISQGDWIEVGGQMGIVKDISVRSTRIETFDRTDVIVPNADFVSGKVTNWTRGNMVGRVTLKLRVSYRSDTREVERILMEICEAHPLVTVDPPPAVYFLNFGDDALEFTCYCVLRDVSYVLVVHSELNHQIHERFRDEGIEIPFAQRDVWLRNPETLQPASAGPEHREPPRRPQPAERGAEAVEASQSEGDDPS